MKGTFILLAFLMAVCVNKASAQIGHNGFFTYFDTTYIQTDACPFNASVQVKSFVGTRVYQTFNNTWNGPIDSSQCINLSASHSNSLYWNIAVVKLDDVDTNKAVFVKVLPDSTSQYVLLQDTSVFASFGVHYYPKHYAYGDSCSEGYCSELLLHISSYDQNGIFIRDTLLAATQLNIDNEEADYWDVFHTTLATPGYAKNLIDEIIYKITPKNVQTGDSVMIGEVVFGENHTGIANIQQQEINTITLLGNPTENNLAYQYTSNANDKCIVAIYNLQGQRVFTQNMTADRGTNTREASLTELPTGEYLLKITDSKGFVVKKFTKL